MKHRLVVAVILLNGLIAVPARGQGPLIDWIHKMSGPGFISVGWNFPISSGILSEDTKFFLAPYVGISTKSRDQSGAKDDNIIIITADGGLEWMPLRFSGGSTRLGLSLGLGVHAFLGDVDTFGDVSIPGQVILQLPLGNGLRVASGVRMFMPLPETAFDPLKIDVSSESPEFSWTVTLGYILF
jgi:hypothetical protein